MMSTWSNRRRFLFRVWSVGAFAKALVAQQTAVVYGQIRRANGSRPGVSLNVRVGPRFNYTDIEGDYRITKVPYGLYQMEIRQGTKVLKRSPISVNTPKVLRNEVI